MDTTSPPASDLSPRGTRLDAWAARNTIGMLIVCAALIMLLAVGTRIVALDHLPPGIAPDELALVQAARGDLSLTYPDDNTAYGPSYRWLVRLADGVGGSNVTTARLPAVLLGLLTLLSLIQLGRLQAVNRCGLVASLVAANSFPLLLFGHRADSSIAGCAAAALFIVCALGALRVGGSGQRWWWLGCAASLGAGLYSHIAFLGFVPVALVVGVSIAVWGRAGALRVDRTGIVVALAALLVIAGPLAWEIVDDPASVRAWLENDWNGDGAVERSAGPWDAVEGYAISWRSLAWDGYDGWLVNLSGRPLLDPLLAGWVSVGLLVMLRHPRRPVHALTLGWLLVAPLPAALVAPGHPGLLLPAIPALIVCLVTGVDWLLRWASLRQPAFHRAAAAVVVLSLLASASWSAYDYVWSWGGADDTYFAYRSDIADALEANERLAQASDTPVYLSLPAGPADQAADARALMNYLRAGETDARWIDGQTTLVIPAAGSGYVVYPASAQPDPALRRLLNASGQRAAKTGQTPEGALAWEAWRVDQRTREALPYTVPTIRFPDGYELVGFSVAPDFGAVVTTGQLPDPPRIAVTLVWSAPVSSGPHTVRARLVPSGDGIDPLVAEDATQIAEVVVIPSGTVVNGGVRELIVTRLSVVVPDVTDSNTGPVDGLVLDVQAGLLAADGRPLRLLGPPSAAAGDYAFLNQIEYVPDAR